jgi:hypothetical protein
VRYLKPILVAALVLVISGLAYAATQASAPAAPAPATAPAPSATDYGLGGLNGLVCGILASLLGWAKNRSVQTGEHEPYQFKYGFPTGILGGVLGIVATRLHLSPDSLASVAKEAPAFIAAAFTGEAGLKTAWRHGVLWVKSLVTDWKTAHTAAPAAK